MKIFFLCMGEESPKTGPGKTVEAGINISRQKLERHLRFKPSAEFTKKRKALHEKLASIARRERRGAEEAEKFLESSLVQLDEEQSATYEATVGEAVQKILETGNKEEQKEGLRFQIVRSVFTQKVFKEKHTEWKEEWEEKAQDPAFDMTEQEYVVEKGREFIMQNRTLVIQGRLKHQLDAFGPKEEDEEEEKKRREKVGTAVLKFVDEHEEEITGGKANLIKLKNEFAQIFLQNGHGVEEQKAIEQLFWDIVDDIEYAVIIREEFEATAEEMMLMSYLDLTDEEWEQRLQKALQKNAKGDLKEVVEQLAQPTFVPTGAVEGPVPSYNSVRELGNASGVHFRRAYVQGQPKERNLYVIDFPYLGGTYQPLMEISFSGGTADLGKATYTIEDPFGDPDRENKGQPLRKPTAKFKASDLPRVMARIQLDYELHKAARDSGDSGLDVESVNKNLSDQRLVKMAERLLNFKFNEKPLLPPHMESYQNLLSVLMKPDGSFVERVKRMEEAINDDALVAYIREILQSKGSRVLTVSQLIENAKTKRGGVKIS